VNQYTDILIVEDCQITIAYLTDFFVKAGFNGIHAVKNGAEGIATFKNNPKQFGLVVLDLELPDMSGTQVAQRIRQIEIAHGINEISVPLVISSAHLTESAKVVSLQAGIQGFFPKPISEKNKRVMLRLLAVKGITCAPEVNIG
jgi:CheY-like chemotaxis protein